MFQFHSTGDLLSQNVPKLSVSISIENQEAESFERYLQVYSDFGFRGLQAMWRDPVRVDGEELVRRANRFGLSFDAVHGSFGSDLDPSSPDDEMRCRTIATCEEDGVMAAALGGSVVVVHPSCKVPADAELDTAKRDDWRAEVDTVRQPILMKSMEELAGIGEEMEIVFAIENLPSKLWFGNNAPELAKMVREIDSPFVRLCFDTGHAHVEAERVGCSTAEQFAKCLDVVEYVHVNDNDGVCDSHEAPGDGTIDWIAFTKVLGDAESGLVCMLEMFRGADEMKATLERSGVAHILEMMSGE